MLQLLGPSTGGIRKHVAWLTGALAARGWSVRTAGPAGVLEGLVAQDAVVPVPRGRAALRRALDGADVLHAHGLKAGWLASTVRRHVPVVVTVHNLVLDEAAGRGAPALRALEGWLPRRVDAVVAVSDEIARRFAGHEHVHVVPPAGPAPVPSRSREEVRAELGVADGRRLVVSVARLHPQKDLPTLFDAVRSLDDVCVAIVGEGPDEARLRAIAPPNVVFAGARPSAADELAAADVVAISSRWESGPIVLLEAMALGRPVVTTDVGLARSLVRDGATGRLVPVEDAPALHRALVEVLADVDAAAAMGEAGRRAFESSFSASALADRIDEIYREVLR